MIWAREVVHIAKSLLVEYSEMILALPCSGAFAHS